MYLFLHFRLIHVLIPVLGFDWLLVFMQPHIHKSTVILATEILLCLMRNADFLNKFRDGVVCGGWLENSQSLREERVLHGKRRPV